MERLEESVGPQWTEADLSQAMSLLARTNGRFPPGVRTIPAELVREVQRERLLAATVYSTIAVGYGSLTVQDIIGRAAISRPTFYEMFKDKEDCFVAAFDTIAGELRDRIAAAVEDAGSDWRARLRGGVGALLRWATEEPEVARFLIVEARASGPAGIRRRDQLLDEFAECLDGMVRGELTTQPSALAAAGVVGGIESVLYARLRRGELDELESLQPSLTYFAVLTYAGKEAAAEEIAAAA